MMLKNYLSKRWLEVPIEKRDLDELPTLLEIKKKLTEFELTYKVQREDLLPDYIKRAQNADFVCNDDDKFIYTKTQTASSFKPNITKKHFLFRGERKNYEKCTASVYRGSEANHLLENVKREEFNILLESHPLYKLFKDGIKLDNLHFLELNNPYGIAQHYGFKTSLLDLSSDFDVASFFATTYYNSLNGLYTSYLDSNDYGVLHVYHMTIPFSYLSQMDKLTSIGLQAFPRSGKQKGFLWACNPEFNKKSSGNFRDLKESEFVTTIYFRHDNEVTINLFNRLEGGKTILPDDELSRMARQILSAKEFSSESFERNLRNYGKGDRFGNLALLKEVGINISKFKKPLKFEGNILTEYYYRIHNGGWEDFCDQVVFPYDQQGFLKRKLLDVITDPLYKSYFGLA